MSMAMMVAMASRKRDERGRYMEGNQDNRMDGAYEHPMGNYSRMDDEPEMRRRRDSRGRYMEHEGGTRMEYDGNMGNYSRMADEPEMRRRRDSRGRYMEAETSARYMPWPEPHIPPYLHEPDMTDVPERHKMAEHPAPMRDRNVVNIRDYQDKRRIGFGENRMHYGAEKDGQNVEAGGTFWMAPAGHDKLTREKAEKWVKAMRGEDPKARGGMWSYEDAKELAKARGIPTEGQEMIDFYVVLNMVYTDYAKVAKKHGVDEEDYYADLACAWLYDPDAKPPTEKLMAYKKHVIDRGEE